MALTQSVYSAGMSDLERPCSGAHDVAAAVNPGIELFKNGLPEWVQRIKWAYDAARALLKDDTLRLELESLDQFPPLTWQGRANLGFLPVNVRETVVAYLLSVCACVRERVCAFVCAAVS
jgi:hypothetical protein